MTTTDVARLRAATLAGMEAAFPANNAECSVLQEDYLAVLDEYASTDDPRLQKRLVARLRALRTQLTALHCRIPLPE